MNKVIRFVWLLFLLFAKQVFSMHRFLSAGCDGRSHLSVQVRHCHNRACEVLGVSSGASELDIKSAFLKSAKQCHPDITSLSYKQANEKMNLILQARNFLLTGKDNDLFKKLPSLDASSFSARRAQGSTSSSASYGSSAYGRASSYGAKHSNDNINDLVAFLLLYTLSTSMMLSINQICLYYKSKKVDSSSGIPFVVDTVKSSSVYKNLLVAGLCAVACSGLGYYVSKPTLKSLAIKCLKSSKKDVAIAKSNFMELAKKYGYDQKEAEDVWGVQVGNSV